MCRADRGRPRSYNRQRQGSGHSDACRGRASLLNVNGDETAAGVALALQATKLVFLTDVEGVLDAERAAHRTRPSGSFSAWTRPL